jgi:hypothetical protein
MKNIGRQSVNEKNNILLYIFLFDIVGIIYCAMLLIFRPLGMEWDIAGAGIILGIVNLLVISCLIILQFIKETWIDKI